MPAPFLGSSREPWFEVSTPEQARLLSSSKALYHFAPFMGRTLGAAEAAKRAGVSTERMLYWVRRFVAAGLLSPVLSPADSRQKSSQGTGRAVKLYSAPSAIKVPFHLTPFEDLSAQLSEVSRFYEELRIRATARIRFGAGNQSRYIYVDQEKGTMNLENGPSEAGGAEAAIESNLAGVLWLPPAIAKEVETQLESLLALFEQYSVPQPGREPYLLKNAFVALDPVQDARWLRDFTL